MCLSLSLSLARNSHSSTRTRRQWNNTQRGSRTLLAENYSEGKMQLGALMGTPCPLQSQAFEGIFFLLVPLVPKRLEWCTLHGQCRRVVQSITHSSLALSLWVCLAALVLKRVFFLFVPGAISTINRYPGGPDWKFGKGVWVSGL